MAKETSGKPIYKSFRRVHYYTFAAEIATLAVYGEKITVAKVCLAVFRKDYAEFNPVKFLTLCGISKDDIARLV